MLIFDEGLELPDCWIATLRRLGGGGGGGGGGGRPPMQDSGSRSPSPGGGRRHHAETTEKATYMRSDGGTQTEKVEGWTKTCGWAITT